MFIDVLFNNQNINDQTLQLQIPRQSNPVTQIPMEVIRQLKMSFISIEEIERLKKDSNMYKSTQRNQLGVAKSSIKTKGSSKYSWIDLFNIGNVMLMRG